MLDLAIRLAIVAMECWLLLRLIRYGHCDIFPAFSVLVALMIPTSVVFIATLRSEQAWTVYLWLQAGLIPFKVAAVLECVRLRGFLIDRVPRRDNYSEMFFMSLCGVLVAAAFIVAGFGFNPQSNAPAVLSAIQRNSQLGLAAFLGIALLYFRLRKSPHPRRAVAHMVLLFAWSATFAGAHHVRIDPGDATPASREARLMLASGFKIADAERLDWVMLGGVEKADVLAEMRGAKLRWKVVNYGANALGCVWLALWIWMFRLNLHSVETHVVPSAQRTDLGILF